MAQWTRLPPEVQELILEEVPPSSEYDIAFPLSTYACVCKSWQQFFEARTFQKLTLSSNDISNFERIVHPGRVKFVKHILLHVDITAYPGETNTPYSPPRHLVDSKTPQEGSDDLEFTATIWEFLMVLSQWETEGRNASQGLTFELGVCIEEGLQWSTKHIKTKYLYYKRLIGRRYLKEHKPDLVDAFNAFIVSLVGLKSLEFLFKDNQARNAPLLPQARVVTNFLINRWYIPNLAAESLAELCRSFPRAQGFHLERWLFDNGTSNHKWDEGYPMLMSSLPASLKRLTIMEELHPWYPHAIENRPDSITYDFLQVSQRLEQLCLSFAIDATQFFRPFWPTQLAAAGRPPRFRWENLRSLALTATVLTEISSPEVNELLIAAANAAMRMPALRLMELWGCERDTGIFRYAREDRTSEISWLGTWLLKLDRRVVRRWQDVAASHNEGVRALLTTTGVFDPEHMDLRYQNVVFRYLRLADSIQHFIPPREEWGEPLWPRKHVSP
ncbi:hypothetical protein F4809DRAFT_657625 [Biscogniauxia mediterranea]|nr:hypothetical protein F4809DRAFT_657625 [Biscogniauxia mediterranea]